MTQEGHSSPLPDIKDNTPYEIVSFFFSLGVEGQIRNFLFRKSKCCCLFLGPYYHELPFMGHW